MLSSGRGEVEVRWGGVASVNMHDAELHDFNVNFLASLLAECRGCSLLNTLEFVFNQRIKYNKSKV